MDVQVGCGGWWNFPGGLPAYSRGYRFVEVNTTFYRVPGVALARTWRRVTPDDFEFTVKMPWKPQADVSPILDVLGALRARRAVVHLSSPWWSRAVDLLHDHGYIPILESRGRRSSGSPVLPCWVVKAADPSVPGEGTEPGGDETYARVFGTPVGVAHHLGEGMVERVVGSVREDRPTDGGRVRIVIHSYQMYEDAERIRRALGGALRG